MANYIETARSNYFRVKDVVGSDLQYFRIIDENGERQSGHGWIEKGRIVQWG